MRKARQGQHECDDGRGDARFFPDSMQCPSWRTLPMMKSKIMIAPYPIALDPMHHPARGFTVRYSSQYDCTVQAGNRVFVHIRRRALTGFKGPGFTGLEPMRPESAQTPVDGPRVDPVVIPWSRSYQFETRPFRDGDAASAAECENVRRGAETGHCPSSLLVADGPAAGRRARHCWSDKRRAGRDARSAVRKIGRPHPRRAMNKTTYDFASSRKNSP